MRERYYILLFTLMRNKASTCRSTVGWQSRAYLPSVALLMICCPIEKICRWSADDRATVGLSETNNLSIDSWVTIAGISPESRLMICCPIEKTCRWSADDRATVGISESINLSIVSWVTIAGISLERRLTLDLLPDRENLSLIGRWSSDGRPIWKHQLVDR